MSPALELLRRPVTKPMHPLALALRERGVTLAQFAEALGVSEVTAKAWVRWRRRPRRADRERLVEELGADYFPALEVGPESPTPRALRPFFKFFGGKHRVAPRYPAPEHRTVVEPFAGSAGYATLHHERDVVLVEKDPEIASVWRYLVRVKESKVRRLPLVRLDQGLDDLRGVVPEAKALIGFWLETGSSYPRARPGSWMKSGKWPDRFWGESARERVASQVSRIRHWRVVEGDYRDAPDVEATWFVDPPYERAGTHYRHGSSGIDYAELGRWVRSRRGLAIACEQSGARWLPFRHFHDAKASARKRGDAISREVVYVQRSPSPKEDPVIEVPDDRVVAVLRALGIGRDAAAAMVGARR